MNRVLLFFAGITLTSLSFSQTKSIGFKNSIGIQYNKSAIDLEHYIWRGDAFLPRVFAVRYRYKASPHLSFGPEFSGYWMKFFYHDIPNAQITKFNYGIYGRGFFTIFKYFSPYIEISLYYSHLFGWDDDENLGYSRLKDGYFTGYVAPGFSISLIKNRVSIDIMYKFSNKQFANSNNRIISFKLNYNFNFKK